MEYLLVFLELTVIFVITILAKPKINTILAIFSLFITILSFAFGIIDKENNFLIIKILKRDYVPFIFFLTALSNFMAAGIKEKNEEEKKGDIKRMCNVPCELCGDVDKCELNKNYGEQVINDSCNITNPFQSLKNVLAFSCRDWSADLEDAWIYGIIVGWGFDEDDEGKSCTDELEKKFGSNKWSKSDTKRLKVLHNNWKLAEKLFLEGHQPK